AGVEMWPLFAGTLGYIARRCPLTSYVGHGQVLAKTCARVSGHMDQLHKPADQRRGAVEPLVVLVYDAVAGVHLPLAQRCRAEARRGAGARASWSVAACTGAPGPGPSLS